MPSCYAYMELKQKMLDEILSKKRKVGDVADILGVSRQSVSKWLVQYRLLGVEGITPKKPGPKPTSVPYNRTSEFLMERIITLAKDNPFMGPIGLRDGLEK